VNCDWATGHPQGIGQPEGIAPSLQAQ